MLEGELIPTCCPTCGGFAYVIESADGCGGIVVSFTHDTRWLGDPHDALSLEQGNDEPNNYKDM